MRDTSTGFMREGMSSAVSAHEQLACVPHAVLLQDLRRAFAVGVANSAIGTSASTANRQVALLHVWFAPKETVPGPTVVTANSKMVLGLNTARTARGPSIVTWQVGIEP